MNTSFNSISFPKTPVKPANKTAICRRTNAFLIYK